LPCLVDLLEKLKLGGGSKAVVVLFVNLLDKIFLETLYSLMRMRNPKPSYFQASRNLFFGYQLPLVCCTTVHLLDQENQRISEKRAFICWGSTRSYHKHMIVDWSKCSNNECSSVEYEYVCRRSGCQYPALSWL
jgi:hypothetical protein